MRKRAVQAFACTALAFLVFFFFLFAALHRTVAAGTAGARMFAVPLVPYAFGDHSDHRKDHNAQNDDGWGIHKSLLILRLCELLAWTQDGTVSIGAG